MHKVHITETQWARILVRYHDTEPEQDFATWLKNEYHCVKDYFIAENTVCLCFDSAAEAMVFALKHG